VSTIGKFLSKINLSGSYREDELLAGHTTFRIGGPADAMVFPTTTEDVMAVQTLCLQEHLPLFVLGRGANILVADKGIRGVTLNLTSLASFEHMNGVLTTQAGLDVSAAAEAGRAGGFSCLEFLNAMPSTIGGAVYMNARCYGAEIADVFVEATVVDAGQSHIVPFRRAEWDYKVSPFQNGAGIIVEAKFRTKPADARDVEAVMTANKADREAKGHFRLPCAGSVFKNNHDFGAPSGVLIDRVGLKGLRRGRAVVSEWHANIIVNEGGATATDLRALIGDVKKRVAQTTGLTLEEEVLYVGDWDEDPLSKEPPHR
jgi:UDP-N-acetylmuramate dehydrogenase